MLTKNEWNLKESRKGESVESPQDCEDDVVWRKAGHDRQRHLHEQQREERRSAAISGNKFNEYIFVLLYVKRLKPFQIKYIKQAYKNSKRDST